MGKKSTSLLFCEWVVGTTIEKALGPIPKPAKKKPSRRDVVRVEVETDDETDQDTISITYPRTGISRHNHSPPPDTSPATAAPNTEIAPPAAQAIKKVRFKDAPAKSALKKPAESPASDTTSAQDQTDTGSDTGSGADPGTESESSKSPASSDQSSSSQSEDQSDKSSSGSSRKRKTSRKDSDPESSSVDSEPHPDCKCSECVKGRQKEKEKKAKTKENDKAKEKEKEKVKKPQPASVESASEEEDSESSKSDTASSKQPAKDSAKSGTKKKKSEKISDNDTTDTSAKESDTESPARAQDSKASREVEGKETKNGKNEDKNKSKSKKGDDVDKDRKSGEKGKDAKAENSKEAGEKDLVDGTTKKSSAGGGKDKAKEQSKDKVKEPKPAEAEADNATKVGAVESKKGGKTTSSDHLKRYPEAFPGPHPRRPNLLMPIRAEVMHVEHTVEGVEDPRPNAFVDTQHGIVRVYHGPQYGNPTGALYPRRDPTGRPLPVGVPHPTQNPYYWGFAGMGPTGPADPARFGIQPPAAAPLIVAPEQHMSGALPPSSNRSVSSKDRDAGWDSNVGPGPIHIVDSAGSQSYSGWDYSKSGRSMEAKTTSNKTKHNTGWGNHDGAQDRATDKSQNHNESTPWPPPDTTGTEPDARTSKLDTWGEKPDPWTSGEGSNNQEGTGWGRSPTQSSKSNNTTRRNEKKGDVWTSSDNNNNTDNDTWVGQKTDTWGEGNDSNARNEESWGTTANGDSWGQQGSKPAKGDYWGARADAAPQTSWGNGTRQSWYHVPGSFNSPTTNDAPWGDTTAAQDVDGRVW